MKEIPVQLKKDPPK